MDHKIYMYDAATFTDIGSLAIARAMCAQIIDGKENKETTMSAYAVFSRPRISGENEIWKIEGIFSQQDVAERTALTCSGRGLDAIVNGPDGSLVFEVAGCIACDEPKPAQKPECPCGITRSQCDYHRA